MIKFLLFCACIWAGVLTLGLVLAVIGFVWTEIDKLKKP